MIGTEKTIGTVFPTTTKALTEVLPDKCGGGVWSIVVGAKLGATEDGTAVLREALGRVLLVGESLRTALEVMEGAVDGTTDGFCWVNPRRR